LVDDSQFFGIIPLLSPRARPLWPIFRIDELAAEPVVGFFCMHVLGKAEIKHVDVIAAE
jgi:hypothetical protein